MIEHLAGTGQGATPRRSEDSRTAADSRLPKFESNAEAEAKREAAAGGLKGPEGSRSSHIATSAPTYDENTPPDASNGKEKWSKEKAAKLRVERYTRRQRASSLLLGDARLKAGKAADSRTSNSTPPTATDEDWVRPPRVARCKWRVAAGVGVHGDGEGNGHLSGVEKCGSISACPVCSAVIRYKRSEDIQTGVENWQTGIDQATGEPLDNLGGGDRYILFNTLTMRHTRLDSFKTGMNAIANAWRDFTKNRAWKLYKARHGVVGYVRSFEVTYTEDGGWHPHLHILFFCQGTRPSQEKMEEMSAWLLARWQDVVMKNGGGKPTKKGFDLQLVDNDGKVLSRYLSKVMEKKAEHIEPKPANIGLEMARADFKVGRGRSWTPLELLDRQEDDDTLTARNGHLFVEYHHVTKGRKIITWSRGLRAILLPDVPEQTDDEIMDDTETLPIHAVVPGKIYDKLHHRPMLLADLVDAASWGDWDGVEEIIGSFGAASDTVKKPAPQDPVIEAEARWARSAPWGPSPKPRDQVLHSCAGCGGKLDSQLAAVTSFHTMCDPAWLARIPA